MTAIDVMEQAGWLARNMPGLGDPMALQIDEFVTHVETMVDILSAERGDGGTRGWVERQARRSRRRGR